MRQMTDDFKEKPSDTKVEDRLEIKSLSRKERRAYKKKKIEETTEGMSSFEKKKYLLYYYKEAILITIGVIIAVFFLGKTIYTNTRPITISYVVINCGDQLNFNVDAVYDYAKAINKYSGHQIKGDTNVVISGEEYSKGYEGNSNSQIYINFTTMATSDYYDVIFTDMDGATACGALDIFYPLDKYLDAETYEKVKDDIVTLKNMDGKETEMIIDISDKALAKDMNLGYDTVYIGFPGDEERNHQAVKDLIDYLY